MPSDFELLDRWSAGDKSSGNELFERHFYSIYYFFANKVQDDVDDLVQATLLACVHGRDKFRRKASFRTYLFAVARNKLYEYLRRRTQDREQLDFGVTSLADMGISPTGQLARSGEHHLLLLALRSLAVEQQLLLELHYWEGMSIAELSQLFDIANTATRGRLSRARKSLRRHMEKLLDDTGAGQAKLEDLDAWARSIRDQTKLEPPANAPESESEQS